MRAIRSKNFKLIHNLMPERAWCQYQPYKETSYPVLALLNVMNLKGELNHQQSAFMAPMKPEFELYDLNKDPYELYNLADDPAYKEVKADMLAALNNWRETIKDQGVNEEFRKGGWPASYPTRTLEEWEEIMKLWEPWVFREPGSKMERPGIPRASIKSLQKNTDPMSGYHCILSKNHPLYPCILSINLLFRPCFLSK